MTIDIPSRSGVPRPPAPNLTPDEMLTCLTFEVLGTGTFEEADHA
jgi:hypothetical protein